MSDATVFDFTTAHSLKQLKHNRAALLQVLDNIRATLRRLFETQLVFHVVGSHAARLMLEAQEQLSAVLDAIDALSEDDEQKAEKLRALHKVLQRVGELTADAAVRLRSITAS